MLLILSGGLTSAFCALLSAAPTLLIGLFLAALLRYYLGTAGTRKLFGGESWISLPQSWLLGMLLPVCSIGVIPMLREMKRAGVRPGALTAFALAAPLFNPLSLLYGLTLSRPYVICGFALASLAVVTILGLLWDRLATDENRPTQDADESLSGVSRLYACCVMVCREMCGAGGLWSLAAVSGVFFMAMILPHGALQTAAEMDDPWAPTRMACAAAPVYAPPMLTMSQLGMMFQHGNSPGAAFALLLLGTGVNPATLLWFGTNFRWKATGLWFVSLMAVVIAFAYAIDKPLIPPGVEPAGHTHAFDIYTNPFHEAPTWLHVQNHVTEKVGFAEWCAAGLCLILAILGAVFRIGGVMESIIDERTDPANRPTGRWDRNVPPQLVSAVCLIGLVAFSIVGCYAYYPSPEEALEEIAIAKSEALGAANMGNRELALRWLGEWEEWTRRMEVGAAIRHFELRPYQQAQGRVLREKLELLEHELEHDELEMDEIRSITSGLWSTSRRYSQAFRRTRD